MDSGWLQGIALVILAIVLEALVDMWMDRFKIVKRDTNNPDDDRHSH